MENGIISPTHHQLLAYAPVLLQRKATRIRAQIAAEKGHRNIVVKTVYEQKQGEITLREWLIRSLVRPFTLFIQEPIIQLFGVYLAFVYGVLYSTSCPGPHRD